MARKFAKSFYNSKAWKECRNSYIKSMSLYKRGLCEKCFDKGIHTMGEELHHKIWLTPNNINDPNITLNHDNLILLCYECHKAIHTSRVKRDFIFNAQGELVPIIQHSPHLDG